MAYLLLCIVSSSLLMVIFKVAGIRKLDNFKLIVINYITASIFGFSLGGFPAADIIELNWLPLSVIIGILFILIFLVMARSTQLSGIAPTTIATKMSVVIPISFSIIYFSERLSILKIAGIILAILSVFLATYRKETKKISNSSCAWFPLLLFAGSGIIDSLVKYTQESYLNEDLSIVFSSSLFLIAAISGFIISPFRKKSFKSWFKPDLIIMGITLGIVNFGSLYGIIMALDSNVFDSSIVFGINNIGIVLLSILLALALFKEKVSTLNRIGIALSLVSIVVLSFV